MNDTALATGDRIYEYEQLDELPVGSVICERRREERAWEKSDDGLWRGISAATGSGPYNAAGFSLEGFNKVLERAGGPPPVPRQETLRQYQWRFRENAISGAHENGVSMDACLKGLRLLRIEEPFPVGPGVRFKSLDSHLSLPVGTVVANYPDGGPTRPDYTLFVWKRHGWSTLLGRNGISRDVVCVQHPEVEETPEWWAEVGTEESVNEILQFKAQAWRISTQIKSEQSWCGTLEHVIGRVGVTHASLREAQGAGGINVFDHIGQRDCRAVPEGSLLFYRDANFPDQWAVYQRDNTADNLTRTRRIAGHHNEHGPALGNYHSVMTLITEPDRSVENAHGPQLLALMPVGTVFSYGGADRYIICRNRLADTYREGMEVPQYGAHRADVFRHGRVTIIEFKEQ